MQSEEMAMMTELGHLEEVIGQLDKHTADPFSLPAATEQVGSLVLLLFLSHLPVSFGVLHATGCSSRFDTRFFTGPFNLFF